MKPQITLANTKDFYSAQQLERRDTDPVNLVLTCDQTCERDTLNSG